MFHSSDDVAIVRQQGEEPMFSRTQILLLVVGFKVLYLSLVIFALWGWGDVSKEEYGRMARHWPLDGTPTFVSHFAAWDGAHYLYLSETGYAAGDRSCAFFPLWPLWVRWLAPLTGGDLLYSGLLWANVFSTIAFVMFYRMVASKYGHRTGSLSLVFLLAFPGSIFFQFIYSESLFFFLLMGLWWALQRNQWSWIGATAFLLPLTRAVGVLAVIPILWHVGTRWPLFDWMSKLVDHWNLLQLNGGASQTGCQRAQIVASRWNIRYYGVLLAPVFGFATYCTLLYVWTDNPLEGLQAQRFWGVHSLYNALNPLKALSAFFSPTDIHAFTGSVVDRMAFILVLYSIPVCLRLDKALLVWVYMLGIFPAMSGTFTSFTRFASTVFPLFVALAVFYQSGDRAVWRRIMLGGFVIGHVILLWRFVNWRWAS